MPAFGARRWAALARIDPSLWVILAGALVRIHTAVHYNALDGYDAGHHMNMVAFLDRGVIPRIDDEWEGQHPPLFYLLALGFEKLGFDRPTSGQVVSVLSGILRMLLANRIFLRLEGGMPKHTRLMANLLLAFLPVSIRMDVFYSNESTAATLAVAAVALSLTGRPALTGLALGAALLTKSSAVAAVPAVAIGLVWAQDNRPTRAGLKRLALSWAIGAGLLSIWAADNVIRYRTPYPPTQLLDDHPAWNKPLLERHASTYYLPRFQAEDLRFPYYRPPISMPNTYVLDTWGDYYNFLTPRIPDPRPPPHSANRRRLPPLVHRIHVVLAHAGVLLTGFLAAGFIGWWRRSIPGLRRFSWAELALAVLALGYLVIAVSYAVWFVFEHHGPVKAAYMLGATPMLCFWCATALAATAAVRPFRIPVWILVAIPFAAAIAMQVFWAMP